MNKRKKVRCYFCKKLTTKRIPVETQLKETGDGAIVAACTKCANKRKSDIWNPPWLKPRKRTVKLNKLN